MKKYILITVLVLMAGFFLCIGAPNIHCQELSEFQKATAETDRQLEKKLKEFNNFKVDIKLYPRYHYYNNRYPSMTDNEIQELMNGRKQIEKMKVLQKKGLNQIKWQRRFNTGKNCLKWGLLIFIAFKI